MKNLFILVVCLFLAPVAWADPPAPPVPVPSGDENLPPPLDLNQMTPVTVPPVSGNEKANSGNSQPAPTVVVAPPVLMTPTPVPAKAVTTALPKKMVENTPTPMPAAPAAEQASSGTAVSAGVLTDYFPVQEGAQWTYEYLKPAPGQTTKGSYSVQCTSVKTMPNGTVRTVFETVEDGQKTQDHYSLFGTKIEHMAEDGQTETGDFVFKVPAKGEAALWTATEKNGTVHKSKAAFGQAQVYQKTYPDCVVVTEKVLKGGKAANTVIYYYAKGIGLVAIEVYSPKLKLLQDKSVAIVKGPGL